MAYGLYDIDDRKAGHFNLHEAGQEKRQSGFPLTALILALLGGAAAILAIGPQLLWSQPESKHGGNLGGIVINSTFNACSGAARAAACVVSPREFSYGNTTYHLSDIRTPDGEFPACDVEAQLAGKATRTFIGILNGGAFESLPDPTDSNPTARILMRDGVSIGQIMIAKGVAQPWAPQPYNWCAHANV
ncbi:nuclease [Sphingobium sp. CFD-1]|uniref:nuclease n=1 Tax=Sphingobium sp. CFD-1 TaxID=2878545 RepID=UPI00214C41E1|nr:nuclease [Sphingobium sp. CFD-1]